MERDISEVLVDDTLEVYPLKRLRDIVVASGFEASLAVFREGVRREGDDGNVGIRTVLADLP